MNDELAAERARRVAAMREDPAIDLVLDANAIGGMLASVFGTEVTGMPCQCSTCRTVSVVGSMRAYVHGPGMVVRCPACAEVVLRIVQTPTATLIDASGARYLRVPR